jgi:hypothetical protein
MNPVTIAVDAFRQSRREGVFQRQISRYVAEIVAYLCDRLGATEAPVVHGGKWDQPGLETVTYNSRERCFLGMHLDSWDAETLGRRHSRTRVSINFGPSRRHFLFVPVPLSGIRDALERLSLTRYRDLHEFISSYFATFPHVPIVRLTLEPGQAYIADTDNMIHDGSSLGATEPTFHFTFRCLLRPLLA